jgi:hypothetical protein
MKWGRAQMQDPRRLRFAHHTLARTGNMPGNTRVSQVFGYALPCNKFSLTLAALEAFGLEVRKLTWWTMNSSQSLIFIDQ